LRNGAPYGCIRWSRLAARVLVVASVQVKRAIDEEESRCRSYLPDVTCIAVINTCRTVFLTGHHGTIVRKYAGPFLDASRRDGVLAVLPVALPSSRPA